MLQHILIFLERTLHRINNQIGELKTCKYPQQMKLKSIFFRSLKACQDGKRRFEFVGEWRRRGGGLPDSADYTRGFCFLFSTFGRLWYRIMNLQSSQEWYLGMAQSCRSPSTGWFQYWISDTVRSDDIRIRPNFWSFLVCSKKHWSFFWHFSRTKSRLMINCHHLSAITHTCRWWTSFTSIYLHLVIQLWIQDHLFRTRWWSSLLGCIPATDLLWIFGSPKETHHEIGKGRQCGCFGQRGAPRLWRFVKVISLCSLEGHQCLTLKLAI